MDEFLAPSVELVQVKLSIPSSSVYRIHGVDRHFHALIHTCASITHLEVHLGDIPDGLFRALAADTPLGQPVCPELTHLVVRCAFNVQKGVKRGDPSTDPCILIEATLTHRASLCRPLTLFATFRCVLPDSQDASVARQRLLDRFRQLADIVEVDVTTDLMAYWHWY
ncbi:hypothetical protein BD310DRAFT_913039 [Dichomitus squalens]|uniref:Uncharacterized protein n=1 Tax=Dichomitus squalens TaxID=114155 RepID=A0A4Q9QBI8_9APHY|nr:hypothetical protein BD310DRAFT_913039 [Dichomitus squalens]